MFDNFPATAHPPSMPTPPRTRDQQNAYDKALREIEKCKREGETTLKLERIGLAELPPEIGQLTALMELQLNNNRLTSLPPQIGLLNCLTRLSLDRNELTSLPPQIGDLVSLKELFVEGNFLEWLPSEIGNLKELIELSFEENKLKTLPPEIGRLGKLKALYLESNRLTYLPPQIGELRTLTHLYLQQNQLKSLPPEIAKLENLQWLFLHGNPDLGLLTGVLGTSSVDVIKGIAQPASPKAILDYYFSRQTQGERPLNEVKLLLLGRGEAGKTSVSRALRGEKFQKDQEETAGIEIRSWELECPGGEPVKVHLWDFAGQEITHETHRYFLTERSLYLVVLDGRGGQQMEEAEYWLSHVERYGSRVEAGRVERSPVIVVLNKWRSPGPYEVEKRRLQREHPNIRAFVETDCKDGHGIETLRQTLCAVLEQMPAVRAPWPLSYFRVREKLAELVSPDDPKERRPFLNWKSFQAVCAECGVKETGKQRSLAQNFNSLGVAMYYGHDARLRDMHVLDPNWAANGLYGMVRGVQRRPFQDKAGHLWAGDFAAVLAEGMRTMDPVRQAMVEEYPEERDEVRVHEFLLDLMQDRELGFQAGEHEGRPVYLLPGLLTLDEPEPALYDVAAHMEQARVRFRYRYEFLPAGVMSRFIVRTHALSEGLHRWQRGVVLGWEDARALVMAERRRNPRVDVFICGGTAAQMQELAGVVRANMQAIHQGLPEGLRGEEELDLTLPGEQYESVEKLAKLEAAEQPVQVVTARGVRELSVTPELEQVQPASARQGGAPRLKVFISYAHANHKLWERLRPYLDILKNEGLVEWWQDGKIRPGSAWDEVIREELKQADIVILLLSTAFFASDYIRGVELREARRRHEAGEAEILPVLLEPTTAAVGQKWLSRLQTVPVHNGALRPITSHNPQVNGWHEVDKALRGVIAEVAERRGR